MADEQDTATEEDAPKSKKTLIMFAGAVLLAIGASVGGTLYFVQSSAPVAEEVVVEDTGPATAIYHSMRPPFVVNFLSDNKSRYLQADITLMSRDEAVVEAVIEHSPLIRSRILEYLADQRFSQLRSDEGKQQTREGLKVLLNQALTDQGQASGIESILLTNFVLQ